MRTTYPRNVLISGAGIAGPALAYWLVRGGARVTIVERHGELRRGGQAVDFRGPVHRAVLDRMGVWDAICAERTRRTDHALYDRAGCTVARLPAVMMGGDVEIQRGDLCRIFYERSGATYRFGDSIRALHDRGDGVDVDFEHGDAERFDLVVGADGLRSRTRAVAFGPHERYLKHHGYRIAGCTIENILGVEHTGFTYSVPGRAVSVSIARDPREARALFVWAAPPRDDRGQRTDRDAKAEATRELAGAGWEVPRLLEQLARATDVYDDDICTAHVDRYARGRVVLLGDAAWGGTLGGQGTSCAVVGAYVLAGELASRPVDEALARYEQWMRPYATRCQKGAAHVGGFFAPRSRFAIGLRNTVYRWLSSRPMEWLFERLVKSAAESFQLPDYSLAPALAQAA